MAPSTALDTICPAAGFRLLTPGRAMPASAGQTVSTVSFVGDTAVTFIANTRVSEVATVDGGVIFRISPASSAPKVPRPLRLSAIRVGLSGVNRSPSGSEPSSMTPRRSTTRSVTCDV